MRAAIYARYSSENQRPESIEDQISSCRRLPNEREFTVAEDHIYSDYAFSGYRKDRDGLNALLAASENHPFDIVLVDDLWSDIYGLSPIQDRQADSTGYPRDRYGSL